MPGADFYRALATARFMKEELLQERDAHNAMKLCFEKIHKSLDMYQGHYINRLRFHLNRHHTEYLRKVRAMRKEREARRQMDDEEESTAASTRRSISVSSQPVHCIAPSMSCTRCSGCPTGDGPLPALPPPTCADRVHQPTLNTCIN